MTELLGYIEMGMRHIMDIGAYDHLLFVTALVLPFRFIDYKQIGILLTAFTLGHGISMLLGVFEIELIPTPIIEFLIPTSILITALYQVFFSKRNHRGTYIIILLFGLIHGLGYANGFMSMMAGVDRALPAIFGFNLGVELAQIGYGLLLILGLSLMDRLVPNGMTRRIEKLIFGLIALLSIHLMINAI